MGLKKKKSFYEDLKWFVVGLLQLQSAFQRLTIKFFTMPRQWFNKCCFSRTIHEEEMPAGLSHSSSCSASRFMSPCPTWFMSPPAGAVEQCHPSQSPLGKPWYPSPRSERVDLHTGEYKAKFHTSIWSFQTLTSAKAAPLSQLWLTHRFLRPGRTINLIPWIEPSGKSHHYSKTRMIFASD